ncbi:valine--tRNA ligase [Mesoplasma entomophilum]|uniref:valine--tRNA ligase n=1 Tax=Mesoplasma entomophilum TaxID=2149 RepID=UPI000D023BFE|nr:valine--tRNA ligase [Mesoplasma entomophilum]AVN60363.1 valine--tRNA ligase [Mesoplasma entomophilum]
MKKELEAKYSYEIVEENRYDWWIQNEYFKANPDSKKPKFSIVLPPPNVTGKLHIGHAWDGSLQEAIIRFKKLNGFDVLYLPGMDHAGISTQVKVEAKLREQGISRFELGREKFLEQAWKWKHEYASIIRQQWAKLGLAFDYSMEKFTLDEDINKIVTEIFVDFYNKGLIYKGKRIVNWDPIQKTAISNVEVIYKEIEGFMYHFKYMIEGTNEFLSVATTRPETMFADQCLVVNPKDKRYKTFIGKNAINPVNNQAIPIIADDYVELEFGTGVMKCTPAHDLNDFEIAVRHNLAKPICMNEDGTINEMGGSEYEGLDRFDARTKIIENLTKEKTFIKAEPIIHQVGFSERSNAIVEPYLSDQWFVKMDSFADMILKLQESDKHIKFFPERFDQVLKKWMENIHDWTISRQLWWGHRIPAWYHKDDKTKIYVGMTAPNDAENWTQDEDVLDTWFSSGLWPFATLMRGEGFESKYFKEYLPNGVLVTGHDIIFSWVSRMIFQTIEYTGQIPFNDVLIHGLVRDENGTKMSKSLGNGIDPMDVIANNGSDSLRFSLLTNSTPGQDIRYSDAKVKSAWNFINKLWNASRYVLMNLEENFKPWTEEEILNSAALNETDKWVLTEFSKVSKQVNYLIDKYEFAIAGKMLYDFVWNTYCSWYIEFAKVNLNNLETKEATQQTLVYLLKNILIMLHPYLPFVTEHIYKTLDMKNSILEESWFDKEFAFETDYINVVIELINSIREFRATNNIKNSVVLNWNATNGNLDIISKYTKEINNFLNEFVNANLTINENILTQTTSLPVLDFFIEIPNDDFIDKEKMLNELINKKNELQNEITRSERMLNNDNFISKAAPSKIEEEKEKYELYKQQLELIEDKLSKM